GSFDAWYQAVGRTLQLTEGDLLSRQASILQASLEDLEGADRELLARLAAFRYPVPYEAVLAVSPFGSDPAPTDPAPTERLHAGLTTLEERGLLQWDREHNRYDLHPVVRAYAYTQLGDKQATLAQLQDYFRAQPEEDDARVQDVADLRRTLEL